MSGKKRRQHGAGFKAQVALEAIKGDQTLGELAARYELHPNQIAQWKKEVLDGAAQLFVRGGSKAVGGEDARIKDLHAKIGELTIERDFLEHALGRIK